MGKKWGTALGHTDYSDDECVVSRIPPQLRGHREDERLFPGVADDLTGPIDKRRSTCGLDVSERYLTVEPLLLQLGGAGDCEVVVRGKHAARAFDDSRHGALGLQVLKNAFCAIHSFC